MEHTETKPCIAELLQQLEELKKKKAQTIEKLKKHKKLPKVYSSTPKLSRRKSRAASEGILTQGTFSDSKTEENSEEKFPNKSQHQTIPDVVSAELSEKQSDEHPLNTTIEHSSIVLSSDKVNEHHQTHVDVVSRPDEKQNEIYNGDVELKTEPEDLFETVNVNESETFERKQRKRLSSPDPDNTDNDNKKKLKFSGKPQSQLFLSANERNSKVDNNGGNINSDILMNNVKHPNVQQHVKSENIHPFVEESSMNCIIKQEDELYIIEPDNIQHIVEPDNIQHPEPEKTQHIVEPDVHHVIEHEDKLDDSLSHNMTCFFSESLMMEDENTSELNECNQFSKSSPKKLSPTKPNLVTDDFSPNNSQNEVESDNKKEDLHQATGMCSIIDSHDNVADQYIDVDVSTIQETAFLLHGNMSDDSDDNLTPSLLDSSYDRACLNINDNESKDCGSEKNDEKLHGNQVTDENAFIVPDTTDIFIRGKGEVLCSRSADAIDLDNKDNSKESDMVNEIFTIPETEFFDTSFNNDDDPVPENPCPSKSAKEIEKTVNVNEPFVGLKEITNPLPPINDDPLITCKSSTNSIAQVSKDFRNCHLEDVAAERCTDTLWQSLDFSQTVQDTLFLEADETQDLVNCQSVHLLNGENKENSAENMLVEASPPNIKLVCCLHSDINEAVLGMKIAQFNECQYLFIQQVTWIRVWRQSKSGEWIKIFSHQVDQKLFLENICVTKNDHHLALVMLLKDEDCHCIQFLLFEKDVKIIKLVEHLHGMQTSYSNSGVLLCGLDSLRFATAIGNGTFEVFVHMFGNIEDSPKLMSASLGMTSGNLLSLCKIEKLPNALMGLGESILYLWHLSEARLVTSVHLQLPDDLIVERCIWATIENGLMFFIAVCKDRDGNCMCRLLAANLATGYCQICMDYSLLPAKETERFSSKNIQASYSEPFLAMSSSKEGAFLWSADDEQCCAALDTNVDTTALVVNSENDNVTIVVGNAAGCVNCCNLKCS